MAILETLAGVGSILGGLGGLFGKKQKVPSPRKNMLSQAQGAREAAEKFGFNPLTMLQYGQVGGSGALSGGGAPPLASIELITGGLRDLSDIASGDAERRRQMDQKNIDLAQIKLDQLRSGVIVHNRNAVDGVGAGLSPIGRNNATFKPSMSAQAVTRGFAARPPMHPQRKGDELVPVTYPDGSRVMIPRGQADRLGVKPFGALIGGDIEELRGEFVGNIETTARSVDMLSYSASGSPVNPAGELEFDSNEKKWVPPFTDPKSKSWWKRPLW